MPREKLVAHPVGTPPPGLSLSIWPADRGAGIDLARGWGDAGRSRRRNGRRADGIECVGIQSMAGSRKDAMKLHWSPSAPFVRKVMVCAHALGLADRIELVRSEEHTSELQSLM